MASGMRDFFDTQMRDFDVADKLSRARQTAGAGLDWMSGAIKGATPDGMRGAAATPAAETPLPKIDTVQPPKLNPDIQAAADAHATASRVPPPAQAAQPVKPAMPNLVQPITSAGVEEMPGSRINPDGMKKVAATPPASVAPVQAPVQAAKPGMLGKAAGKVGSMLGGAAKWTGAAAAPIAAVMTAKDAIANGTSNMDQTISEEMGGAYGGVANMGMPSNVANSIRGSMINVGRRFGNTVVPDFITPNFGDKAVGAARDMIQGNPLGTTQFDPNQAAAQVVQGGDPQSHTPASASPAQPQAPNFRGTEAVPAQQWRQDKVGMDSSTKPAFFTKPDGSTAQYEVPQGGMVIQNDQTGATSAYRMKDPEAAKQHELARMAASNRVEREFSGAGRGMRRPVVNGPFGAMAALGAYGAAGRMAKNKADLGLKKNAQALAYGKAAYDIASKERDAKLAQDKFDAGQADTNRGIADKEIANEAVFRSGKAPTNMIGQTDTKAQEANVKGKEADLRSDINYTLGNRKDGKKIENMSGAERQQLFLAKRFKDKAEQGRTEKAAWVRDFFGSKRVDTKDLYSYMPDSADSSVIPFSGGYKIRMRNGNTLSVNAAAGGGFNFTGPNDPVDADAMALVAPVIKKYEDSKKGK